MTRRKAQFVLLCEDQQHEVFVRRFLGGKGVGKRLIQVEKSPAGAGAANRYVVDRFPGTLQVIRKDSVTRKLIVIVDGDNLGVVRRLQQLDRECEAKAVPKRTGADPVAVLVPSWNIESWLAYLGGATVDEGRDDYPRFAGHEKDTWPLIDALVEMCDRQALRQPAPPSLEAACGEYRNRLAPL